MVSVLSRDALEASAGDGLDAPGNLEARELRRYRGGALAGGARDLVHGHRPVPHRAQQARRGLALLRIRGLIRRIRRDAELGEHILRAFHELCSLPDELVATLCERRVDR